MNIRGERVGAQIYTAAAAAVVDHHGMAQVSVGGVDLVSERRGLLLGAMSFVPVGCCCCCVTQRGVGLADFEADLLRD